MIKELLLKQEIEKYRYISKEDRSIERRALAEGKHGINIGGAYYSAGTS